jgi:hypothetical protein
MPLMICPENNCPRRKGDTKEGLLPCPKSKPHEHNTYCDSGCYLHGENKNRKPCKQIVGRQ